MVDLRIELGPDPDRDATARRNALALVTATVYEAAGTQGQEMSAAALNELVERVVGEIGEVREESVAALQHMLAVVARQYSAFAGVAHAIAAEAFSAGQQEPDADEPDYEQVLARVSALIEGLPGTGG